MALAHSPSIVLPGLVLCLDAGNPKSYPGSGTTWTDLSGNGNNGTLVNGVGYNSDNGGSLSFDGSNDYVNFNKTATQFSIYNTSYSMCAYFKIPNLTGDKMVFGTGQQSTRQGMHHGVRYNTFYFGHYAADASGSVAQANTWYFGTWVWTTQAPTARIYINSKLVGSSNAGSFLGTSNIFIGNSFTGRFTGNIAQASIYNRALSASEIQQNFNATRSRYGI